MDINTEVRHGETLLAADRRCYRVLAVRTSAVSPARPEPEGGGWSEEWTEQVCRGPGAGLWTLWTLWTLSAPSKSVFRLTLHCGKWWPAVSCDAR